MTKWYLFSLLSQEGSKTATIRDVNYNYHDGIVVGIEREDGSGRSFNVKLYRSSDQKQVNIHVRTID